MLALLGWVFKAAAHQMKISTLVATSEDNKKARYTKRSKKMPTQLITNVKN